MKYTMPAFDRGLIEHHTYTQLFGILCNKLGDHCDGYSRMVFIDEQVVYKLPYSLDAESLHAEYLRTNVYEYICYLKFKFGDLDIPIAPCELLFTRDGVPIIVMARVFLPRDRFRPPGAPKWERRVWDGQVGILPSGEWAVYDAGTGILHEYYNDGPCPEDEVSADILYDAFAKILDPEWVG